VRETERLVLFHIAAKNWISVTYINDNDNESKFV